jgi:preprotein translocase subunit YajC
VQEVKSSVPVLKVGDRVRSRQGLKGKITAIDDTRAFSVSVNIDEHLHNPINYSANELELIQEVNKKSEEPLYRVLGEGERVREDDVYVDPVTTSNAGMIVGSHMTNHYLRKVN